MPARGVFVAQSCTARMFIAAFWGASLYDAKVNRHELEDMIAKNLRVALIHHEGLRAHLLLVSIEFRSDSILGD
jgi:hypothetical protein